VNYLLIFKPRNDKSKFLAQAGFTEQNPEMLKLAIQQLVDLVDAVKDEDNEYGTFYRVNEDLTGVNQQRLPVTTIWIKRKTDNKFQFVTLKPFKEPRTSA